MTCLSALFDHGAYESAANKANRDRGDYMKIPRPLFSDNSIWDLEG